MKHILIAFIMTTTLSQFTQAQTASADETALRSIVQTMEKAWNTKNGELFASSFAEVHDYIVWTGLYLRQQSVANNARAHQGLFNGPHKDNDLRLKVDQIKFIRPDLALVHAIGAAYPHGTAIPENPGVIISMLCEKQKSDWKIISFHNCDIEVSFEPGAPNGLPMPAKVMYAGWYAEEMK